MAQCPTNRVEFAAVDDHVDSAHTTYNDTLDNCVGRQLLLPFKLEPSSTLLLKLQMVRATYQDTNKGATVYMELT